MTTKQYLSRAYNLRRRIAAKEMHLEELRAQAEHITADLTGMPRGSGAGSPVERIAVQIADASWDLHLDWLDLIAYQEEIRKVVESIEDPVLMQVLSLRYISYKPWYDIAETMHYTIGHIFKLHKKALKKVEQSMILNDTQRS